MTERARQWGSTGAGLAVLLALLAAPLAAQRMPDRLAGLRLADALRALQTAGLRIVFTSELVTPEMRVSAEPHAKTARECLAELLEPHGLGTRNGPGGTILVVRQPQPEPDAGRPAAPAIQPNDVEAAQENAGLIEQVRESVLVTSAGQDADLGLGSGRRLGAAELGAFGSHVGDDPVQALQTQPGVGTGHDFRSELSVRASPPRHAAVVVDGVAVPWLHHGAPGRGDAGTLTMLGRDVVEEATLSVGAYARRESTQLGPLLNLTLREGSRLAIRSRAGTSDTAATFTSEGPIGSSRRGSWLIGLRKSYVEWPFKRSDHEATVFGFTDLQSKLVYDAHPAHQVSLSVVAGVSNIERDQPNAETLGNGMNEAALITASLRSLIGGGTAIRQQASFQAHAFENRDSGSQLVGRGTAGATAYRADVTRGVSRHLVEAGVQIQRQRGSFADAFGTAWWERSGYLSFRWIASEGAMVASGVRVADSTLIQARAVDRWIQFQWSRVPDWRVYGSAGLAHQFPALEHIAAQAGTASLRPERAAYLDLGVAQQVTETVRWSATAFARRERDVLRVPAMLPCCVGSSLGGGTAMREAYENALRGSARGVDLVIERRSPSGVSGWAAYTFGVARHRDVERQQTFRADFDQRHTGKLAVVLPLRKTTSIGVTLRAGSNAPIPGYLVARDDALFVADRGDERNTATLPAYARFDLRGERIFQVGRQPVTIFAEVLNLLNHANYGLANGIVVLETREAVGFTERLYRRLVTGGLRIEF